MGRLRRETVKRPFSVILENTIHMLIFSTLSELLEGLCPCVYVFNLLSFCVHGGGIGDVDVHLRLDKYYFKLNYLHFNSWEVGTN